MRIEEDGPGPVVLLKLTRTQLADVRLMPEHLP